MADPDNPDSSYRMWFYADSTDKCVMVHVARGLVPCAWATTARGAWGG